MSADFDFLRDHVGKLGSGFLTICAAAILALSRLLVKREVKRIDDRHLALALKSDGLENRMLQVEGKFATKDDVREIFERMNAIGDRSEQRHAEIMSLIISNMHASKAGE